MLVVLCNHAIAVPLSTATLPLDATVRAITYAGWTGLDMFFVLSGYLITGILLDSRGQPRWWSNFMARRALRVFPLYYGTLAVLFVLLPWLVRWSDPQFATLQSNQAWYWTYTVNVLAAVTRVSGTPLNTVHLWSLSIEEQFYLVWPLIVWVCRPRTLLRVVGIAVLAGFAFRLGLALHDPVNPYALYALTPCRLDGLMIGAALAVVARAPGGLARLRAWVPGVFSAGMLALIAMALWRGGLDPRDPVVSVAAYPVVALVCGTLLVTAVTAPATSRFSRVLCTDSLRKWGRYSYGIYIVHFPLLGAIEWKTDFYQHGVSLLGGSRLPLVLLLAAIGMTLSYTLGYLSYHLYERRFLALKRYFDPQPATRITVSLDTSASIMAARPGAMTLPQ
jgi:peptidoglycan/LPS O-acetylase OafA/YrhL